EFHYGADEVGRLNEIDANDRLPELLDLARVGHFLRLMDSKRVAVASEDFIRNVGSGLNEIDVRLALKPLLHDLHVQQAKKAAAKAKTQGVATFRLEFKTGVVERKLVKR